MVDPVTLNGAEDGYRVGRKDVPRGNVTHPRVVSII